MLQMTVNRSAGKLFLAGLLGFLVVSSSIGWTAQPQPRLVVFGDSVSDPGNAFALTRTNNTPPDWDVDPLLVPNSPYAIGGHHLSNGSTWIEDLAQSLRLAAEAGPAWRDSGKSRAANYAVAQARAYDDHQNVNLATQVTRFLQDVGGHAPAEALYVLEIGGSDIRDALMFQNATLIQQGIESIFNEMDRLYGAGARKFLVLNSPNIGLLPSVRTLEATLPFPGLSGLGGIADQATQQFNLGLAQALAAVQQLHPDIQIQQFDLYAVINEIYSAPADFGLTEVNTPCITPNVPPFKCRNPDEYAFWDGVHPTKAVHAIIAQRVGQSLVH